VASQVLPQPVARVLVVDDHPVFRTGLAGLIDGETDMEAVGEAGSGREALEQFDALHPDITLLDLQMPEMDGVEVIRQIRATSVAARIIVVSANGGDVAAARALKAGAQAYISKSRIRRELLETIRTVRNGQKRVSEDVANQMARYVGEASVSEREIQVLNLIATGNSNKWIARLLGVSEETAKTHVKRILSKLNARDRTHAVTLSVMRGILQLPLG
jgi:DNA-binding NarL/FixJ family response regulator